MENINEILNKIKDTKNKYEENCNKIELSKDKEMSLLINNLNNLLHNKTYICKISRNNEICIGIIESVHINAYNNKLMSYGQDIYFNKEYNELSCKKYERPFDTIEIIEHEKFDECYSETMKLFKDNLFNKGE